MRIVCISDTHRERPKTPEGDILIYAGDDDIIKTEDLENFIDWIEQQPQKHKVVVGGNHDFLLSRTQRHILIDMFEGIHYLENTSCEIEGFKIWGSPYSPLFGNWCFMKPSNELKDYWDTIPEDTDILITHTPPLFTMDKTGDFYGNQHCGCKNLKDRVENLDLKLHVFGHIHEGSGQHMKSVNASYVDEHYKSYKKNIIVKEVK